MARFLRDQIISNITVTKESVKEISDLFLGILDQYNINLDPQKTQNKILYVSYIIRFDDKGYRVFFLEELLEYFHQGKKVGRIIFTIENLESLHSNRQFGTFVELRLDSFDPYSSNLMVSADEKHWVDSAFSAVKDVLKNFKNFNKFARSEWTRFLVQMIGVALGFFVSWWAASQISPSINIQNSFVICLLSAFLIFSNLWGYLNQQILKYINFQFPNIKFFRRDIDKTHWLKQGLVITIGGTLIIFLFKFIFPIWGKY